MRIIFVSYQDFGGNSSTHIFHLANALVSNGVQILAGVPESPSSATQLGSPAFETLSYGELLAQAENGRFSDQETIVHAWTPRERVRKFVQPFCKSQRIPYLVHLEDNEDHLASQALNLPASQLSKMSEAEFDRAAKGSLSHPLYARAFLQESAGITAVIDRLLEFKAADKLGLEVWPGFDPALEPVLQQGAALRRAYGVKDNAIVIAYTGNVHSANAEEVSSLYVAVGALNRHGIPTKLLRTGIDHVPLPCAKIPEIAPHVLAWGFVDRKMLADIHAAADFFVQPGRGGAFNDYRFPSKIPSFLNAGKPVLLPATNIGRFLSDGVEAVLLKKGDAIEIADRIASLSKDPDLCARLRTNGKAFAAGRLCWKQRAVQLIPFYKNVLATSAVNGGAGASSPASRSSITPSAILKPWKPAERFTVEVLSCHLPKTAGKAFLDVLQQAYGTASVLEDNTFRPEQDVKALQGIRAVHGHFHGSSYRHSFPDATLVTWLRNPASRLISHYFYWKDLPLQEDQVDHRRLLEENLGFREFAQLEGMRNHLARNYLNGLHPSDFDFIGIQEHFEEDVFFLARKLGWPQPSVNRVNKNSTLEYRDLSNELLSDKTLMAEIQEWNRDDYLWYEEALKIREVQRRSI